MMLEQKDKYLLKNLVLIIIVIMIFSILNVIIKIYKTRPIVVNNDISSINLKTIENLMIVAHPDDETLWGASELINHNYLVVCITCGTNRVRVKEFENVMNKTDDQYLMLGYPDKTKGKRNDWSKDQKSIINDLEEIINFKKWNKIITHNPKGEYGHIHHKKTSRYVTDIIINKDQLLYFGNYYNKNSIEKVLNQLTRLEEEIINYKVNELISEYKSQPFLNDKFSQMYAYENIITYNQYVETNETK